MERHDAVAESVTIADTTGRWLPPPEAAEALGVAERTMRRYIARGEVRVQRTGRWLQVWVPASAGGASRDNGESSHDGQVSRLAPVTRQSAPAADVTLAAVSALERALVSERERAEQERGRADREREKTSAAEQAAAMWQERARNLEVENGKLQELLALPAHEEPEPRRRWWQWWGKPASRA